MTKFNLEKLLTSITAAQAETQRALDALRSQRSVLAHAKEVMAAELKKLEETPAPKFECEVTMTSNTFGEARTVYYRGAIYDSMPIDDVLEKAQKDHPKYTVVAIVRRELP